MRVSPGPVKPLTRRIALVTGASGGIGHAIARGLAAEGAAVALGYGEHSEPAEKLAAEIVDGGGLAVAIAANLRRPDAPDELVDAVESQLGAVEVLVAAAGSGKRQSLEEVSIDDFDEMMAVNLRAPFRLAQRTVPGMRELAPGVVGRHGQHAGAGADHRHPDAPRRPRGARCPGPGRQAGPARGGRGSGARDTPQPLYDQPGRRTRRGDLPALDE